MKPDHKPNLANDIYPNVWDPSPLESRTNERELLGIKTKKTKK